MCLSSPAVISRLGACTSNCLFDISFRVSQRLSKFSFSLCTPTKFPSLDLFHLSASQKPKSYPWSSIMKTCQLYFLDMFYHTYHHLLSAFPSCSFACCSQSLSNTKYSPLFLSASLNMCFVTFYCCWHEATSRSGSCPPVHLQSNRTPLLHSLVM